ncbi:MAG: hypothetical protein KME12_24845 [Trichocoleus desertorum ATA4-8-CV12]|jgi:hypothetical protein|nr:hypothetical protein [Trichocoleus desertorum ATA4-8-CV12]
MVTQKLASQIERFSPFSAKFIADHYTFYRRYREDISKPDDCKLKSTDTYIEEAFSHIRKYKGSESFGCQ